MKMNKKGFTLIEMLVVIAIIAVLVAIVIPVVGNSTEAAKEAADAANIRAAISEVTTKALLGDPTATKTVKTTQTGEFKENEDLENIGGFELSIFNVAAETTITVSYCETCNGVIINNGTTTYSAPGTAHSHTP